MRLLLNPASGRRHAAARLAAAVRSTPLDVVETTSPCDMTAHARRAAEDGLDRVLVAGGDGAVHYALQGLAGTECALGIVPLGSGNDLARALGIDRDPHRALLRALQGPWRVIDLGRIEDHLFAGIVGLGIDGDVCRIVHDAAQWLPGSAAYVYAALRSLLRYQPPHLRVDYAGGSYEGRVLLAAVANSSVFGGGMRIAPGAALDDGWLDLIIVEQVPLTTLLRVFPRVYRGRHLSHPAVHSVRVRRASFHADPPRRFYADGEPLMDSGDVPTPIEIWPGALRVVA